MKRFEYVSEMVTSKIAALKMMIMGKEGIYYINGPETLPPPLKSDEEAEIMQRIQNGDENAREPLITHNLRLVVYIAKKFESSNVCVEDLISIGTIGLIKGINTYRRDRGVRLTSYASRCIENEILMFFRSRRKCAGELSLSDAIETEDDGGGLSLLDVVSEEQDLSERICERELCAQLRREMERTLDERERRILTLRYGLDGAQTHTQRETAELCAISRSYVSRLEKHALEKLRRALEA